MRDQGLRTAKGRMTRQSGVLLILLWSAVAAVFPCHAKAASITKEEIKAEITRYVESSMPWPPGTLRLSFKSQVRDVTIPGEKITLEIISRRDTNFVGDAAFTVKYFSELRLAKEETVMVVLEVLREVVVSTRNLEKNREIAADDVCVLKKWVRLIPENVVTAPDEVIGKVLNVTVRQNREITRNVIKEPLLIKKGNLVRIILENGRFTVTAVGVSEEDGSADALIRVKNMSSSKIIYARVVSDSLVRVEF